MLVANFNGKFNKEALGKRGYVVNTQYCENYGYRWKFKGGDLKFIECEEHSANEMMAAYDAAIEINNDEAREIVVSIEYRTLKDSDCDCSVPCTEPDCDEHCTWCGGRGFVG